MPRCIKPLGRLVLFQNYTIRDIQHICCNNTVYDVGFTTSARRYVCPVCGHDLPQLSPTVEYYDKGCFGDVERAAATNTCGEQMVPLVSYRAKEVAIHRF